MSSFSFLSLFVILHVFFFLSLSFYMSSFSFLCHFTCLLFPFYLSLSFYMSSFSFLSLFVILHVFFILSFFLSFSFFLPRFLPSPTLSHSHPLSLSLPYILWIHNKGHVLTLSQMTNIRLIKLKDFADDNFKFNENGRKFFKMGRKHCGKRRNCALRATRKKQGLFGKELIGIIPRGDVLTHYQTTNFGLFQTDRVCRRQFQL